MAGSANGGGAGSPNGGTAGGSLAWNHDGSGFWRTRYPEPGERPDPDLDDERRRYYRLTSQGHSVLGAELERLDAAVSSARSLGLLVHGGRS